MRKELPLFEGANSGHSSSNENLKYFNSTSQTGKLKEKKKLINQLHGCSDEDINFLINTLKANRLAYLFQQITYYYPMRTTTYPNRSP